MTRMLSTWYPLACLLLLSSCAAPHHTPVDPAQLATQQRLEDMERRIERLEARPPVEVPYRNREEIQAHILSLEQERTRLLVKYTDQHPAVRDIDRKLHILNEQRRMMAP